MQKLMDFDAAEAERLKTAGMSMAEASRAWTDLEHARKTAEYIAIVSGTVTADDVADVLAAEGYPSLGNAAGSLFKGKQWEFTGEWRKSKRVSSHSRFVRVWRLKKK